jgi:lantibiotic modifying enzyme
LQDASAVAAWLTADVISADERLDVMSGAAGALLGLLCLYSATRSATVLDQAMACGDHLILHRTLSDVGHYAWKTLFSRLLTGFSHGAAGISYALLRLYGVTAKRTYLDAAMEGIEFERAMFSQQHANWPDLRDPTGKPGFVARWCNGAAGIGLARSGCRKIIDIEGLGGEIEIALHATLQHYFEDGDDLCCGSFGRAEMLLVGSEFSDTRDWRLLAQQGIADAIASACIRGEYRLFTAPGLYNPAFFKGMSGIGYQILRFASEGVPSVLLLE